MGGTWVDALLQVSRPVPVDLGAAHKEDLDPDQLADGEGQVEAQVLGTVQLHLASVHPASTCETSMSLLSSHCHAVYSAPMSLQTILIRACPSCQVHCVLAIATERTHQDTPVDASPIKTPNVASMAHLVQPRQVFSDAAPPKILLAERK